MNCRICLKVVRKMANKKTQRFYCHPCGMMLYDIHQIVGGIVRKAQKIGKLKHPSKYKCVDCGARAECYDHRNYGKPLRVSPVCRGCNYDRGGAKASKWIMEAAAKRIAARKSLMGIK